MHAARVRYGSLGAAHMHALVFVVMLFHRTTGSAGLAVDSVAAVLQGDINIMQHTVAVCTCCL